MKKTVISTVVLAAISSTSAFAANQWGFDITDAASGNSMTVRGTPGDVYDMDKLQNGVDANKQAADDAAKKADDAQNTADRNTVLIGNNATTAGRNASDILALQRSAVISNGQATQLRQDLDTTVQKQNVINQNQITKNQSQDSKIQTLTTSVQTLTTQAGNFASKSDLQKETDERTKADADLQTNIDEKVDQTTYDAGQKAQDDALKTESDRATKAEATKVDKTTYDTDQKRQDDATDALKTAAANAQRIQSQINSAINTKNQKQDADIQKNADNLIKQDAAFKADQARQDTLHAQEVKFRQDGDAKLQTQVDDNKKAIADKVDTTTYDAGQKAQDATMKGLRADVDQNQSSINGVITGVQTAQDSADQNKKDISALTTSTKQQLGLKLDKTTYTADQTKLAAEQAKQDAALKQEADSRDQGDKTLYADIQQVKGTVSTKANQSDLNTTNAGLARVGVQTTQNKKAIADNAADIATNTAGLTRVGTQTTQNKKAIADNAANIATTTAAVTRVGVQTTQNKTSISKNSTDIAGNTTNITNNTTNITNNRTDITALEQSQTTQNARFTADETTETNHFKTLQAGVKQAQDTGTYAQARADQAFANADANRQALNHTNQRVADNSKQLANHEQRIQELEANNQTNFKKLEKQQNRDRNEFRAGLAGAFALTSIPAAPTDHTVGIGMGAGTFNGENAIAAGVSSRMSSNVSVKTGLSWDTQGNVGAGAGFLVSY
ncbi:MAG: YadA-like family protein [Leclercia sp.]